MTPLVPMRYRAMDAHGRIRRGRMEAAHELDLEARLRRLGLDLVACAPARSARAWALHPPVRRGQLINFCFHLEQLLTASVPIPDALADLRDSVKGFHLREVIAGMVEAIHGGASLSEAMARHPRTFDSMIVNLVRAGETSGQLPVVLRRLTESLRWHDEHAMRFRKVLVAPILVAVVIGAVIVFLMLYLVPRLAAFIETMGEELPIHARALIAVSRFAVDWWYLAPAVAAPWLLLAAGARMSRRLRRTVDALRLRVWFIGPLRKKLILARFVNCFALMYASGISVLESIRIGEGLLANRAVEEAARTAANRIAEGASISEGFEQAGLFPPLVLRMLRVGESTGALDTALSNIGYFYERDVRDAAERVQALIGPASTLVLGAMLLWVVISVMGPIYEMVAGISL
ncbi:MAG: type II secretion system F family protein [Immundisolibacterales bacterium]|nr:type II secretion system F family protein [Immundisolibacterales bacterium]